jgi:FKBP12-rapamycin complex-associated protein
MLSLKSVTPDLIEKVREGVVEVPNHPGVLIKKFFDEVEIKSTKRRPRVLRIFGTDGRHYKFLLKGKDDLRQDERVFQFFDLVNSIESSSLPKLTITGVTPLSPSTGLIQWIAQCDNMYDLVSTMRGVEGVPQSDMAIIRTHGLIPEGSATASRRAKRKRTDNQKLRLLTPFQRLEVIETLCTETSANSLRDVLWLRAPDSAAWVKQIQNFSTTAAVMSIVGYVIGLGDRHPGNLMVHRQSGSVIHVDFGDCFEVAKERKASAEVIPFRLTRMMVAAMGPCGIEGPFRKTCEQTMRTLRIHREAVMSVAEIFVREPVSTETPVEGQDEKLRKIMKRMTDKLNGTDFDNVKPLTVDEQVDQLIHAAVDQYHLAHLYFGWRPTW